MGHLKYKSTLMIFSKHANLKHKFKIHIYEQKDLFESC